MISIHEIIYLNKHGNNKKNKESNQSNTYTKYKLNLYDRLKKSTRRIKAML